MPKHEGINSENLFPTNTAQDGREPLQCQLIAQPAVKAGGGKTKGGGGGGGGPASTVRLDVGWVGEHAAQVARMLPGGQSYRGRGECTLKGREPIRIGVINIAHPIALRPISSLPFSFSYHFQ